ncbi:hypothetical protein [Fidelibacter multiformis]
MEQKSFFFGGFLLHSTVFSVFCQRLMRKKAEYPEETQYIKEPRIIHAGP